MTKTTVVRLSRQPYDVYIGRPSKYGNPFRIGENGTRDEVCDLYARWLREEVVKDPELLNDILGLHGKRLGCYCAPLRCHGDEIVKFIEEWELSS